MPALSFSPSTPAGRAAALINDVYGQYVQDLTVSQGDKLSLSTSSGEVTSLADIATHLFQAAGKTNDALGASEAQQKEAKEWLNKVEKGSWDKPEELKAVDEALTSKNYVAGDSFTAGDLSVFAAVHPYIASASHSALLSHPSLTRHFDHIQHLPLVSSALSKSSHFSPSLVEIDVNNVPVVEIKPDVKVKKPKAEGADAAAAAAAPKKEKKEAAAAAAEPAAEKKGEKKEKAAAKEGEQKGDGKKKEKKAKEPKPAAAPAVAEAPAPWMVDLRVGKIVDVKVHPDADSLYVEKIDVGEAEPRTVISGLVKYKTLEEMQGATLITVCNLKPVSMRGIKSFAMVLCASSKEGKDAGIEFVDPPAGSVPGDRVYFEGFADKQPLEVLNPKKKIFETVQPGFTTLDNRDAAWVNPASGEKHRIVTDKGVCAPKTFVGASLS
ncbi:hypothetical protein JCM11251_002993 [Rhodosporidiobolus azoricus]